jgi:hypothetical protein
MWKAAVVAWRECRKSLKISVRRPQVQDLKPGHPEHEAGALNTRHSVYTTDICIQSALSFRAYY